MLNPLTLHYESLLVPAPTNTDAATIPLALTPTSADVADLVDSNTERVALTPSAVEEYGSGNMDVGTESLKLTPSVVEARASVDSAVEVFALVASALEYKESVDAATEDLRFTILVHECYARAVPSYVTTVFLRWDMQTPFATWEAFNVSTRWNCFVIGTSLEIPC
jgi:hypothetical protein